MLFASSYWNNLENGREAAQRKRKRDGCFRRPTSIRPSVRPPCVRCTIENQSSIETVFCRRVGRTDAGRLACHLESEARAGSPSPEGRRLDVTSPLHCMQEEEEGGGGHGRAVIDGPRERPCPATATLPASMLLPHARDGWSGREEREERARAKSQCGRGTLSQSHH